jgi:hypothetical protein
MTGSFFWDGEGFANSAENVHFSIEGDGSVPVLRATLFDGEGNGQERDLNLSERVSNNDGNFEYSKSACPYLRSTALTLAKTRSSTKACREARWLVSVIQSLTVWMH